MYALCHACSIFVAIIDAGFQNHSDIECNLAKYIQIADKIGTFLAVSLHTDVRIWISDSRKVGIGGSEVSLRFQIF